VSICCLVRRFPIMGMELNSFCRINIPPGLIMKEFERNHVQMG
jgi:hypothetical protein